MDLKKICNKKVIQLSRFSHYFLENKYDTHVIIQDPDHLLI